MKKFILISFSAILFLGSAVYFHRANTASPVRQNSDQDMRQTEESYLRAVLPETLLAYAHLDIAQIENVSVAHEPDGDFLALNLFQKNKKASGGVRAEISIDYPYHEGDTLRYAWQFKLPEIFPSDSPLNRWWVMGQWHDQPDVNKGETWDDYESKSPPVLFGYGSNGKEDLLSFTYGTTYTPIGTTVLKKGVWNTITVDITWSQSRTGKATVYLNNLDTPVFVAQGANMLNGYQHYMKIGQYRHPDIATANTVYIRNVSIVKK